MTQRSRRFFLAVAAIAVCLLVSIYAAGERGTTGPLSGAFGVVLTPLQKGVSSIAYFVSDKLAYFTRYDELQEENAQLKGAIKKNEEAIEAHSVRIAELMKEHEHGILTTTTDKLLVDFVTSTSRRVSSEYLKQNYPSIYEEARKPSKNRKVKVTIQPL